MPVHEAADCRAQQCHQHAQMTPRDVPHPANADTCPPHDRGER